ncbi:MAG TPA: glycosyltransferase [Bryobacteraceae bacterium]|nr:glycosyltransferase [Bryobacteraceae bacterium]
MRLEWAGAAAFLTWAYLLLGRSRFWAVKKPAALLAPMERPAASIAAVIPARNEAAGVAQALRSLAAQKYRGDFHIVLVDDASEDGTAEIARASVPPERLTVLRSEPLPTGWTGKLWAVAQGVAEANRYAPDYLLLTDADIVHSPGALELLAGEAAGGYDLVSWMVTLRCESLAERALMPAFVFFFFMLYPPAWIANPRYRTAGAAGGCMLVRRTALERIGGIARIRGELIDDCALARAIKQSGGRVRLELNPWARSIRDYPSFGEVFRMISRTAYTELRYSPWRLAAAVLGLALTFFVPPVATLLGSRFGLAAWLLSCLGYAPMLRYYKRSMLWAPLLPLVAGFYLAGTLHSAWSWRRGTGGMWKGRAQARVT